MNVPVSQVSGSFVWISMCQDTLSKECILIPAKVQSINELMSLTDNCMGIFPCNKLDLDGFISPCLAKALGVNDEGDDEFRVNIHEFVDVSGWNRL